MLRSLQTHPHKVADATFQSATPTVRGQLVQKDFSTKTAVTPTSQEGLYWVNKDNYPTGLMSVEGELSDYDERLENIKDGEFVVLEVPLSGEVYGTTEFVATGLVNGDYLEVETAGANARKLKKASAATKFRFNGTTNDNGHTLAVVEVV
ncbi:hypothetical protein [Paenibacillus sp. QZ-Y1]|uniref:hypothetical protein n=1 Tax=Paenibacillus sp. QZ-Y1 TaxID=3414511 RepID=UPI003F7AB325